MRSEEVQTVSGRKGLVITKNVLSGWQYSVFTVAQVDPNLSVPGWLKPARPHVCGQA